MPMALSLTDKGDHDEDIDCAGGVVGNSDRAVALHGTDDHLAGQCRHQAYIADCAVFVVLTRECRESSAIHIFIALPALPVIPCIRWIFEFDVSYRLNVDIV